MTSCWRSVPSTVLTWYFSLHGLTTVHRMKDTVRTIHHNPSNWTQPSDTTMFAYLRTWLHNNENHTNPWESMNFFAKTSINKSPFKRKGNVLKITATTANKSQALIQKIELVDNIILIHTAVRSPGLMHRWSIQASLAGKTVVHHNIKEENLKEVRG